MNRFAASTAAGLFALALYAMTLPVMAQPAPAPEPAAPAAAPAATPAATGKTFSVQTSTIGELLDNPAAKAIFVKYLPDVVANPQIDMGRDLTLPDIVQYDATITPDKLTAIDAELKALPPQ